MRKALCLLTLALVFAGCARMVVRKHPGPQDTGIRFYRPKPYLFIGPGGPATEEKAEEEPRAEPCANDGKPCKNKETELSLLPVVMRVEYLPDYSEEYSIKMKPGLGTTKLAVALKDGWNLTSVNAETDQQYDEILKSVADLVGSIGSLAGAGGARGYGIHCEAESNVPLGYYEAVLAYNECGTKELIGWRYIGFMPCLACPVKATVSREGYECGQEPLYALVFKGHVLRMERMDSLDFDCPACATTLGASATDLHASGMVIEDVPAEEAIAPDRLDTRPKDDELPPLPTTRRHSRTRQR